MIDIVTEPAGALEFQCLKQKNTIQSDYSTQYFLITKDILQNKICSLYYIWW